MIPINSMTIGHAVDIRDGDDIDWKISQGIEQYREQYGVSPLEVWVHTCHQTPDYISGIPVYKMDKVFVNSAWIAGTIEVLD